jgi:hypothetical protein
MIKGLPGSGQHGIKHQKSLENEMSNGNVQFNIVYPVCAEIRILY